MRYAAIGKSRFGGKTGDGGCTFECNIRIWNQTFEVITFIHSFIPGSVLGAEHSKTYIVPTHMEPRVRELKLNK